MQSNDWKTRFQAWQAYAARVDAIARRVNQMRHDRGWAIAKAAGIGRDMCCIHNASIAEPGHGWGANPATIKAAKRARFYLDDWRASRLADRIIARAYPRD